MSDWTGLIETMLEAALLATAFIATYEGARRLAARGLTRIPALMLAIGLVVPVLEGAASLKVPAGVQSQSVAQSAMHAAEPPGGWEKAAMTPEQRTALSNNAAEINYLLSGQREQVIDAAGNRVLFSPTQRDLHDRESLVREQKGAEDTGQQFLERGVRLFASAAAFMLIGLIVGRVQRGRP